MDSHRIRFYKNNEKNVKKEQLFKNIPSKEFVEDVLKLFIPNGFQDSYYQFSRKMITDKNIIEKFNLLLRDIQDYINSNQYPYVKKVVLDLHTNFPKNLRMSLDYEEDFKIAEKILEEEFQDRRIEGLQGQEELYDITDEELPKYFNNAIGIITVADFKDVNRKPQKYEIDGFKIEEELDNINEKKDDRLHYIEFLHFKPHEEYIVVCEEDWPLTKALTVIITKIVLVLVVNPTKRICKVVLFKNFHKALNVIWCIPVIIRRWRQPYSHKCYVG